MPNKENPMRHSFIASSGLALSALALLACSEGGSSSSDNGDSSLVTTRALTRLCITAAWTPWNGWNSI